MNLEDRNAKSRKKLEKETLEMLDNQDMLKRGNAIYKAREWKGGKIYYEEIDLEEYDRRIDNLARKIASMPQVDLLDILKDALYDLNLKRLSKVEGMLEVEIKEAQEEKREAEIKTTKRNRGTCVNLAVGKKFALMLRQ